MKLPECEADTFEIYYQWLLEGELVVSDEYDLAHAATWDGERRANANEVYFEHLQKLAIFADSAMDTALNNTVVDLLLRTGEEVGTIPTAELVSVVYSRLPQGSVIRKLLVDIWHGDGSHEAFKNRDKSGYPYQSIFDVLVSFKDGECLHKDVQHAVWSNRCHDHLHDEKVPKFR